MGQSKEELIADTARSLSMNRGFLGREFLTWLWCLIERRSNKLTVRGLGEVKFFVDDKIFLVSPGGTCRETTLKGGTPSYSEEARYALKSGKQVSKANFIITDVSRQWSFTIDSNLTLMSVKLPVNPGTGVEPAEHMNNRLKALKQLQEVISGLYLQFMNERSLGAVSFVREWALGDRKGAA